MVAHDCHLSYKGSINRRIMVQTDLDINVTPHFKKCLKWEAGGMAQVIDHLSGMHKALSANPSMTIKMWMIVASQANIILMMHQEPWGYVYNEHNTDEETEAQRALTFCYNSVVEPQSKPGSLASQSILFFFFWWDENIEFRTLHLQSRHSIAWALLPVHFTLVIWRWGLTGWPQTCDHPDLSLLSS
jgi:hypothetical protein